MTDVVSVDPVRFEGMDMPGAWWAPARAAPRPSSSNLALHGREFSSQTILSRWTIGAAVASR